MKRPRRQFLHLAAFGAALAILSATLSGHAARAQNTKTIKIVVALAPGGGVDLLARLLGEQIGRTHGLRMIIENRPGAGTAIGTEAVSRATPDGNTVLMMGNSFVINPNLKKLKYDPLSFEPVCYLATSPEVIVVNSASSYRTLTDLLGAARAAPNELSLASNGPAAAQHIAFEMLRLLAKVNMTYVPFPGTGPAMNALLGQHVTAVFADYPAAAEQLRPARCAPWLRPHWQGLARCRMYLPSPSPDTRATRLKCGMDWSRQRRLQKRFCLNSPTGSSRHYKRPRPRQSSSPKGTFQSESAAMNLVLFCAKNTMNTAA
jgi:hypothetical protein